MRLLSTLLALLLGVAVAAVPAAPVRTGTPAKKEKSEEGEGKKEPKKTGPVTERVVLRAGELPAPDTDPAGGVPAATPDEAPAIRARHLPARPPIRPPFLSVRAAVRAGLLSVPPPAA